MSLSLPEFDTSSSSQIVVRSVLIIVVCIPSGQDVAEIKFRNFFSSLRAKMAFVNCWVTTVLLIGLKSCISNQCLSRCTVFNCASSFPSATAFINALDPLSEPKQMNELKMRQSVVLIASSTLRALFTFMALFSRSRSGCSLLNISPSRSIVLHDKREATVTACLRYVFLRENSRQTHAIPPYD